MYGRIAFALFLLCFGSLQADQLLCEQLDGIVFVDRWGKAYQEPKEMCSTISVSGVNLLRKNPKFLRKIQKQYIKKPLYQSDLNSLKQEIVSFYQSQNQPFVIISIPKQDLDCKKLKLVIEEPRLNKIYVEGNCYFPSYWFSEAIRIRPQETIDAQVILEDLAWLNLNPFRRTDLVYLPSDQKGFTDIKLVTIDRWPNRLYMGADNTGTIETSRNRQFFGFNFGKSTLRDGQISYQFTFAPNWNLFYAHTASARLPLPWRHIWLLWGGYASVEPKTGISTKSRGVSWQVDTRYRIPFFTGPSVMQTVVVGYDFKETNHTLLSNGTKIFKRNADINQFMCGYDLGYKTKKLRLNFNAEIYFNPGGITFANQTKFYEQLQYGAKSQYAYFHVHHSLITQLPMGSFTYDLNGQLSTANLLPSEQMTLTGYNAVRGFEERILTLDNALLLNMAYETPRVSLARAFKSAKRWDEFYLLLFFDSAIGKNHKPAPGQGGLKSLGSIGPGARWQFDRYFTARFDYGIQLWHDGFPSPSDSRYNFGMMLSY